jgi:flavin-dependent dehydrogenase
MASAILSGKLAARAVVDGIGGRKDTLMWYQRECDRLIVREMKIALQMARMRERYPRLFLAIFFSDRTALDTYLDIAAGRTEYRHFRRWLLARLPGYVAKMLVGTAPART